MNLTWQIYHEDGEFAQMTVMDLATGKRRVLTRDIPWDVDAIVMHGEDSGDDSGTKRDIACVLINPLQSLHPNAAAPSDNTLVDGSRSAG